MKIEIDDLRMENEQLKYNYEDMRKKRNEAVSELRRCSNARKLHELETRVKELEVNADFYKKFVDTFDEFIGDC